MEKRTETVVRGTYKIFNLHLDFPFLRVYQMLGIADNLSYLLIDYDRGNDPYGLGNEMDLWRRIQEDPFPQLLQFWENNQIFSLVLRPAQGTPWLDLAKGQGPLSEEQSLSLAYLPQLVKLFQSLHEFQIAAFDCEALSARLFYTDDRRFQVLPAILYHLYNRRDPVPEGLTQGEKEKPIFEYTRALGRLLCYTFFRTIPAGDRLPDPVREESPPNLVEFLDFLIAKKAKTFPSVLEQFKKVGARVEQREKTATSIEPEAESSPPSKLRLIFDTLQSQSIWGKLFRPIRPLVRVGTLLIQLTAFVFFLVGTYYSDKLWKLGKGTVRLISRLRRLEWEDVRRSIVYIRVSARQDMLRIQTYLRNLIPISQIDLLYFTRYLAILLRAGVPLSRSLEILLQQTTNRQVKEAAAKVYDEVLNRGSSLSRAMSTCPRVFSDLYVNMVSTGEVAGHVDKTFQQISNYLEINNRLKQKLKSAVTYPIAIAVACIVFFSFFVYIVLPKFVVIFDGLNVALPLPTRILVKFVSLAHSPGPVFLTLFITLVIAVPAGAFIQTLLGKERVDYAKLQIPIFGGIYKKVLLARFSSTFGSLMDCGVPLLKALEATGKASGNEFFHEMMDYIMEETRVGTQLSSTMGKHAFFPKLVLSMVQVGEDAGQLGKMLSKVQEIYENDVTDALQRFVALIEPALMGVMGLVVGFVVLAIFLPVYQIVSQLG